MNVFILRSPPISSFNSTCSRTLKSSSCARTLRRTHGSNNLQLENAVKGPSGASLSLRNVENEMQGMNIPHHARNFSFTFLRNPRRNIAKSLHSFLLTEHTLGGGRLS